MSDFSHWGANILLTNAFAGRRIRVLYVGEALRTFAVGLIAVFEPIYLYLIFKQYLFSVPAAWVLLYYAFVYVLYVPLALLAVRLIYRLSFRFAVSLSFLAIFLYYPALFLARLEGPVFLFLALGLLLVHMACFWPIYHIVFTRSSIDGHRGEALGRLFIVTMLAGALGPALGGFLLSWFGYPLLFLCVLIGVVLAFIPYLVVGDRETYHGFRDLASAVQRPTNRKGFLAFIGEGVESSSSIILWPLFLFLIAVSYKALGIITMSSLFLSLVATYVVSRISDRRGRRTLLVFGAPFVALSWIIRTATVSPMTAFFSNAFAGAVRPFAQVPFSVYFYDRVSRAKGREQWSLIFFREFALNVIGRGLLFLGGALFLALGGDFRLLLLVAVPASLAFFAIVSWARNGQEKPEAATLTVAK